MRVASCLSLFIKFAYARVWWSYQHEASLFMPCFDSTRLKIAGRFDSGAPIKPSVSVEPSHLCLTCISWSFYFQIVSEVFTVTFWPQTCPHSVCHCQLLWKCNEQKTRYSSLYTLFNLLYYIFMRSAALSIREVLAGHSLVSSELESYRNARL